jgi:hypothetical protein
VSPKKKEKDPSAIGSVDALEKLTALTLTDYTSAAAGGRIHPSEISS